MKKLLRITWLVMSFIVLLPLIVVFEVIWIPICIHSCRLLNIEHPIREGFKVFWRYVISGIKMNIDFVNNGL